MKTKLFVLFVALTLISCGKKDEADESFSEIVTAGIAGLANQTESNGTVTTYLKPTITESAMALFKEIFTVPSAFAEGGYCPTVRFAECDSSGAVELIYDNCSGGIATWKGSQKLQFSSLAVCEARTGVRGVPTSGNVLRTFGGSLESNPTAITLANREIVLDSSLGGTFVEFSLDSDSVAKRTATIRGVNLVGRRVSDKKVFWNQTMTTAEDKPIVISDTGANKQIVSGELVVQHNLANFIGRTEIQSPLTFSANCCHPTGGSIQITFEGSKSGSQTLRYSESCGQAELVAEDGSEASLLLRHCF
jgi:hypothetical protein